MRGPGVPMLAALCLVHGLACSGEVADMPRAISEVELTVSGEGHFPSYLRTLTLNGESVTVIYDDWPDKPEGSTQTFRTHRGEWDRLCEWLLSTGLLVSEGEQRLSTDTHGQLASVSVSFADGTSSSLSAHMFFENRELMAFWNVVRTIEGSAFAYYR